MGTITPASTSALRRARSAFRAVASAIGPRADRRCARLASKLTRGLTVFVFHDVTAEPSEFQLKTRGYTSPAIFTEQIKWIQRRFEPIAPTSLAQLGGSGTLPANAALVTFDDSWAGVFRTALPILHDAGVPALCFLNMGTINGDPDLAVVRRYETLYRSPEGGHIGQLASPADAAAALQEIRDVYAQDAQFAAFQGETATAAELAHAQASDSVWFGSHMYNHWDLRLVATSVCEQSLRENALALSSYSNYLPAFATTHGYAERQLIDSLGALDEIVRVVFTATGGQNRKIDGPVLDRVAFPPEPASSADWWYATHRRRLFGNFAS